MGSLRASVEKTEVVFEIAQTAQLIATEAPKWQYESCELGPAYEHQKFSNSLP